MKVDWNRALGWVCGAVKCVNLAADVADLADQIGGEDADAVADVTTLMVGNLAE